MAAKSAAREVADAYRARGGVPLGDLVHELILSQKPYKCQGLYVDGRQLEWTFTEDDVGWIKAEAGGMLGPGGAYPGAGSAGG